MHLSTHPPTNNIFRDIFITLVCGLEKPLEDLLDSHPFVLTLTRELKNGRITLPGREGPSRRQLSPPRQKQITLIQANGASLVSPYHLKM